MTPVSRQQLGGSQACGKLLDEKCRQRLGMPLDRATDDQKSPGCEVVTLAHRNTKCLLLEQWAALDLMSCALSDPTAYDQLSRKKTSSSLQVKWLFVRRVGE